MRENIFQKRKVVLIFSALALISGFVFFNQGITGNIILTNKYSVNLLSLTGALLVLCGIILAAYLIKKK